MARRTPKANSVYSQTTDVLRRKNLNVFSRISRALNDSFVANYLKNNSNARLAIVVQSLGRRVPSASTERYTLQRLRSERFEDNNIQQFAAAKVRIVEFGDYSIGDPSNEEFFKKVFNTTTLNEFASLDSAAAALGVNLALRDMHPTAVAVDNSIEGLNFGDVVLVEVDDAINPNDIKILSVAVRRVIAEPQFGSSGTILNPEPPLNNIDSGSSSANQPDEITPGEQTIFLDRLVKAGLPQINSFIDPVGVSLTESIQPGNTSWHGAGRPADRPSRLHLGLDVYCVNSNSKYPAGVFVPLKNNFDSSLNFIIKQIKYFKINNEQVKEEYKHDFLFAVAKEDINYDPTTEEIIEPATGNIAFFKTSSQTTESDVIDSVYVVEEKNKFIEFFYNGNEDAFKEQMRSDGPDHIVFHIPGFQADDDNNEFLHESSYTTSHQVATNMVGFDTSTNVPSTSLANLNTYTDGSTSFDVYKLNMEKIDDTGQGLRRGGYYIPPVRFIAEQGFRFSATKDTVAGLGRTGFNLVCEIKHNSMNGIVKPNKSLYLLFYHLSGFPLNILKNETVFNENFPQEHFAYLGSTSIKDDRPHYHFELITNMDDMDGETETDSLFINYIDAVKRREYGYIGARIGFDPSRLYTDGAQPNSPMSKNGSYFSSNQTRAQDIYNSLPAPATELRDRLIREFSNFQENYLNARKRNFR